MTSIVEEIDHLCGPGSSRPELCNNQLYREMADLRLQKQHMEGRYFDVKKGLTLNSRSRDKIAGSRIPISRPSIRRPPSAAQTRNTSPVRGSPLKGTSTVSSCSLPEKKRGAPDRKPDEEKAPPKRPVSPPRMNVLAKQIFCNSKKAGKWTINILILQT